MSFLCLIGNLFMYLLF